MMNRKSERGELRQVCNWNSNLYRENRRLCQELQESEKAAAKTCVERDTALLFLDVTWEAAAEGQRP